MKIKTTWTIGYTRAWREYGEEFDNKFEAIARWKELKAEKNVRVRQVMHRITTTDERGLEHAEYYGGF